ncbi:hypothetical protein BU14_0307s0010 [Porphyra umbilicalis]|uniref:Uncharacterized protein n=1 Tax=Porphyra umbilicalis TaxID=2786 RepID=A0A1X6NZS0_PORUM|nr:hypothetical protein BU14_0307s0010 [Porphyra umbilicalis]|eukprot:OSX74108.1 hypothetical protein BU14_0307s0010 [Porphyra umbilicalis]
MGGRKRSYTEAMLAAATAALEDADREGFGTPQRDARARALPVRARRSSRRATSSPATVAAAAPAAAPSAAPETCGAAGPANADAGSDRRRITRLGATRLGTGSLGTAHSVKDSGEGSSRDDGGDGTRGDGGNDGGDGVRGNGAHYDVAGGHRRRHQVSDVVGRQADERKERIKRIEMEEQMEIDAAVAASRAIAATEAAARMGQSMEVMVEEPMVDDDASARVPAVVVSPECADIVDMEVAFEATRAQRQDWLALTRTSRERATRVPGATGGSRSDSPPVDGTVEPTPSANRAARSPYQAWLAARRASVGRAAAPRAEGSRRGGSRGPSVGGGSARSGAREGATVEDDGAAGRGRGRSWSHAEKMALCRAWLAVSRDPIVGTDQTSAEFFAAVVEAYRRGFTLPAAWLPRSAAAVIRFLRYTLFKNVQLFSAVYARVHRRNMTGNLSEEDLIRAAKAEFDAGDAYEAARADPDHDPEEPEPQGRARGRGFRAADWIPSWRILRMLDKFGGAAAATAATTAPPRRGRGPTSASARVREYRGAGDGEGAEEEDGGEEEEPREVGSQGAWRTPKWEAIPMSTKRAKATRSVEISMQRDCALMARTLGSLAEAANDRVAQSFFFSRWMRDSQDTRRWVEGETQRHMLRCRQRLLGAEVAETRWARFNHVNGSEAAPAEARRVAHAANAAAGSDAASAEPRVTSPSQTPSATMASASAAAAAASTAATTRSTLWAPAPVWQPSPPPPPTPQPPSPPPSQQPPPPPAPTTRRALSVAGVTPAAPLLRVPRPPRPVEDVVVLPPLVSPAATPVICISSGTSSVVEPPRGVAAVVAYLCYQLAISHE